jgi:hypothetical protein
MGVFSGQKQNQMRACGHKWEVAGVSYFDYTRKSSF